MLLVSKMETKTKISAQENVRNWLSMMLQAGGEANTISYNTVIKACAEARDVATAEHCRWRKCQPQGCSFWARGLFFPIFLFDDDDEECQS